MEIFGAWVENLVYFLVLMVTVMQLIPGETYKKYIRFYIGLILILIMLGPIIRILQMEGVQNEVYQEELERIKSVTEQMEDTIGT